MPRYSPDVMLGLGDPQGSWLVDVKRRLVVCTALGILTLACSGSVERVAPDDEGATQGTGGTNNGGTASGGTGGNSTGGNATGGTPDEPYIEPDCPDEPPPVTAECDPLEPYLNCPDDFGCYPFLEYPYGEGCGHPSFGAICAPASTGEQGEFCGDEEGYCAPGFMCVVGAAGGKRCGQICEPIRDHGCPDGLICGETDIQGFGVCF